MQLKPFHDHRSEFSMLVCFPARTLFKFFKDIRIGFKEGYVSEGMNLVMFRRLVSK